MCTFCIRFHFSFALTYLFLSSCIFCAEGSKIYAFLLCFTFFRLWQRRQSLRSKLRCKIYLSPSKHGCHALNERPKVSFALLKKNTTGEKQSIEQSVTKSSHVLGEPTKSSQTKKNTTHEKKLSRTNSKQQQQQHNKRFH